MHTQFSPTSPNFIQNNTLLLPLVNLYKDFETSILSNIGVPNNTGQLSSPATLLQVVTPSAITLNQYNNGPSHSFSQEIAPPPLTASKSANQPAVLLPLSQSHVSSTSLPPFTNYSTVDVPSLASITALPLEYLKKQKPKPLRCKFKIIYISFAFLIQLFSFLFKWLIIKSDLNDCY